MLSSPELWWLQNFFSDPMVPWVVSWVVSEPGSPARLTEWSQPRATVNKDKTIDHVWLLTEGEEEVFRLTFSFGWEILLEISEPVLTSKIPTKGTFAIILIGLDLLSNQIYCCHFCKLKVPTSLSNQLFWGVFAETRKGSNLVIQSIACRFLQAPTINHDRTVSHHEQKTKAVKHFFTAKPLALTLKLIWVTMKKFIFKISKQHHADKWWEWRKISIRGLMVDPIPNSPNCHHRNCMPDSKENY